MLHYHKGRNMPVAFLNRQLKPRVDIQNFIKGKWIRKNPELPTRIKIETHEYRVVTLANTPQGSPNITALVHLTAFSMHILHRRTFVHCL